MSLTDCHSQTDPGEGACPLVLRLGSASALKEGLVTVNCSTNGCSVTLLAPPWHTWLRVVVESNRENHTVTFNVSSNYTGGLRQHNTLAHFLLVIVAQLLIGPISAPAPWWTVAPGRLDLSIILCCQLVMSLAMGVQTQMGVSTWMYDG